MTDLIETRLRKLFADDADHAPSASDLAGGARHVARRQRRQQGAVAAAAVGVVVVLGWVGFVQTQTSSTPHFDPATGPNVQHSFTPTRSASADETSALYYRNVEVPVPASMLDRNNVSCGSAIADAAYVVGPYFGDALCGVRVPHPERITTVVLQPWKLPGLPPPTPGTHVLPDGRTQMVTAVPGGDLRFIVTSPDPQRAQALFNGLRIVDRARGCPVSDPATRSAAKPDPGSVTGGSVCAYQGGWLVNSSWLDANQAAEVAELLQAPLGQYLCLNPLGTSVLEHWDVRLRTPTGEVVTRVPYACPSTTLTKRLWALAGPQG